MNLSFFIHKFKRFIQEFFRYLFDWVATLGIRHNLSDTVVLVKVDAIGDFVIWLETARALRNHYQGRKIVLVANDICSDLAEKVGYFDQVVGVNLRSFEKDCAYRHKVIRDVFSLGAETAIQSTYSRKYLTGDSLIRATGAIEKIGSVGDLHIRSSWQRSVGDRWYTHLIPAAKGILTELERNWEFLEGLGVGDVNHDLAKMPIVEKLSDALEVAGKYFIIFPGAGSTKRIWPIECFTAVARTVSEKYGWQMVVCGDLSERDIAQDLVAQANLSGSCNLAGRTTLTEFVELVRGASIVIANETSAIHIAAAVGVPSVCLLGGGHFGRFVPYPASLKCVKPTVVYERMDCFGCNWHCIYTYEQGNPVPCIAKIQTQKVIDAVCATAESDFC